MLRLLPVAFLILAVLAPRASAGDPVAPADVRKAIERALPFVEADGRAWMQKRDCMSCHVVTFMLWAHVEAQAHGVGIDAKKVGEWTDWSMKKSLAARVFFKLDAKAVEALPRELQGKVSKLVGVEFTHEAEFVDALTKVLLADEVKQHQPDLIKLATVKRGASNDGGGLDTVDQLLLARDGTRTDVWAS
jgi:hypothetical protein